MKPFKIISGEVLRNLTYDPTAVGCVAGADSWHLHNAGYVTLQIDGEGYLSHRVVWALHHGDPGSNTVDHINGDRMDARIENLRLASKAEQSYNMAITSRNTSGVKGLHWCNTRGLWTAQIRCAGKTHKLRTASREEAEAWLSVKRVEIHGEFARG